MNTKVRLLELLEKNREHSISGEEIAGLLGVTRAAVWKAARALERDGHVVEAAPNRGYRLAEASDVLTPQGMLRYLDDETWAANIKVYGSLESTNRTAKELALAGCVHGTVVVAGSQTAGRGRYGRPFFSPPEGGLYMSVVLRPDRLRLPAPTWITAAAGVAVCRAVQTVCGLSAGIKWVNDIFLDGKKVCGILTEAAMDLESGGADWVIVGIGINVTTSVFPGELEAVAGALVPGGERRGLRGRLAAAIINQLLGPELWADHRKIHAEYRARLMMLGLAVTVAAPSGEYEATALDIDENGGLIVERADGGRETLNSGEVRLKLK